jgi:serine/threonine protein kinase
VNIQSLSPEDPRSLGRYELLERLGWGSQGIVYLARDPASGTQVAVKLLHAHMVGDDAARARFLREVEAAKRVARFCTAQVLDASVEGARPYVVSEYIAGPSLAEVIRSDGPRTGGALDRIAINTATALGAIHQAGVVHRDFKAANVLLGPDGPVVIDFGVAKALDTAGQQVTMTGQAVGTPAYMAPEQFADGPVGPEADIFAWGVTMANAATGTLPFGGGSIPSVMHTILNGAPDLGGLRGPMRDLVAACLAKDPAARPTARQIVDRLMSAENVSERTGAEPMAPAQQAGAAPAGDPVPGAGVALWTTDPLREVRMRQESMSAVFTGAPPLMPAGGPTGKTGKRERPRIPRIPRVALIAAAVVIVLAGGTVGGLMAFTSSGAHNTAATGGAPTPTPTVSASGKSQPASAGSSQTSSSSASTISGANGSTTTTHYDGPAPISSRYLAPAGKKAGTPYFTPAQGDWDWLDGVRHCETIGHDKTAEGIICLTLLEGNSGGTTWYRPVLIAYCNTISTKHDVKCAKISGDFGMYSATGVQEAPKEYGVCGQTPRNQCSPGSNLFVDINGSSWMTVSTAAADSCQSKGGKGTDCEIYPYAYGGVDIELPRTHKNVTLGASYKGLDAIGY